MISRLRTFFTPVRVLEAVVVLMVIFVTVWTMHPSVLFSSSTITGGDTGSHIALPAFLKSQGGFLHLTPWYPGWFNGMPAYTYYFVLPDYFAVLASYVINFAVAFKLVTILGSVLLPVTAYAVAKLFRAPRPVPAALAVATLPFLFDASFTIDGGNLFSTMAGEYSFSFSLALSLLTVGLFARGVRTGRGYWVAAISLSATLASHVLPWFFCVVSIAVLVVFELLARRGIGTERNTDIIRADFARPVRFAFWAGLLSLCLSAWWLVSFLSSQAYTNTMGYVNDNVSTIHQIFTHLGWFNENGSSAGDRWVIVLATVAFVLAFIVRDRLGMVLATLGLLSLIGFIVDPQSVIWNERIVPFWFLATHLSAGWLFGYLLSKWIDRKPKEPRSCDQEDDELPQEFELNIYEKTEERRVSRTLNATLLVALLGLGSVLPGQIAPVASALHLHTSGNQVGVWAQWNYSGYEAKAGWNEYQDIMTTMKSVSAKYGCGNAMWEYASGQDRFGTPEALMLLPYWTNNCVGSMEGLFFESSATTPYHFINQSELSAAPSNAQVGLDYGTLDVVLGVKHLQMLGVKYYMAFSPTVIAQASVNPSLQLVATTKAWPSPGATWSIYLIKNSPVVQALSNDPVVIDNVSTSKKWLSVNQQWYNTPSMWNQLIASSGPEKWKHISSLSQLPKKQNGISGLTSISNVVQGTQSISFHVSSVGTPVLVKMSYFPRWHVSGATGPYRVSPNEMVVIPTSKDVSLTYDSGAGLGGLITSATVLVGLLTAFIRYRWRSKTSK
jgi:hypothetical protein